MFEEKTNAELYETSNIVLAGFLLYSGFKLWGIKKDTKENRKVFVFERSDGFDKTLEIFWKKEAKVDPENFFLIIKALKSRIHDAK